MLVLTVFIVQESNFARAFSLVICGRFCVTRQQSKGWPGINTRAWSQRGIDVRGSSQEAGRGMELLLETLYEQFLCWERDSFLKQCPQQ